MELFTYYQYFPGFAAFIFLIVILVRFTYLKRETLLKKPLHFLFPAVALVILCLFFYLLSKAVLAEYFFRMSLKKNTVNEVYEYQRKAIITNPNIDRYRVRFSQTNLLIANALISKVGLSTPEVVRGQEDTSGVNTLSAEDRQTATTAIQISIEEAKAAVALNDKKASNWANLGAVYKNLLTIAENADTWSISSYQRAIVLEPNNSEYYLELGGIYYLLKKYDDAIKAFEEAKRLKPNWANLYYNLAWTYYQKGEVAKAISNMETTISLLSNQGNSMELSKAQKELEEFRKEP